MKYVNQLQYPDMQYITRTKDPDKERRKVGLANTIAKSGCGLCSSVMVADRLRIDNGNFEIEDARQLSYDSGANHSQGTDGRIAVLDSAHEEGCYEKEGRKGKVEVLQPGFSRCSLQVIKEEIQTVPSPFFLFWRK